MLEGIRVIDFSFYLPGPYTTLRLADLGAEVIKIEPPLGDPARTTGVHQREQGFVFQANNRNKKSVILNLKEQGDRDIALKLIERADVVLESFRPGVMNKLGLDYETVKKVKDDLIYCSLSGYGQTGIMSRLGSHDLNYMALSGVLDQLTDETHRPIHPSITLADLIGGLGASEAILAAVLQRERTGKGAHLDIAMTDVLTSFMTNHVYIEKKTGDEHGVSMLGGEIVSYAIYQTKDYRYVSLAALEDKFWRAFCLGVKRPNWIKDHFSPAIDSNLVYQEIKALFKDRTMEEWTAFSMEVDCCLTPVLKTGELIHYPYFKEKELLVSKWGAHFVKTNPTFSKLTPSPDLGADKERLLKEWGIINNE